MKGSFTYCVLAIIATLIGPIFIEQNTSAGRLKSQTVSITLCVRMQQLKETGINRNNVSSRTLSVKNHPDFCKLYHSSMNFVHLAINRMHHGRTRTVAELNVVMFDGQAYVYVGYSYTQMGPSLWL